ncbi:MAG: hypothetical protein MI802_25465, partial [Desulfobacterales bacterium]|nr:hypothetical protein [Desulfobacterales bacterium]
MWGADGRLSEGNHLHGAFRVPGLHPEGKGQGTGIIGIQNHPGRGICPIISDAPGNVVHINGNAV